MADQLGNIPPTTSVLETADKGANSGVAELDAGGLIPASQIPPIAGGASLGSSWTFDSGTTDVNPGNKKFRFNNATQTSATFIYIDYNADSGSDMSNILLALKSGDKLYIQESKDATKYHLVTLSADPTDATTYVKLPITFDDSGADLTTKLCGVILLFTGAAAVTWSAPNVDIGSGVTSGASLFANVGAGFQVSFANNADNELLLSIPLSHNSTAYDGSSLTLTLDWALFSTAPGGGDNVLWEVDYAFVKDDATQNPYTLMDATTSDDIDVSARTEDVMYSDTLSTMTGVTGAAVLLLTIRRNGMGGGSDAYGSSADIYGITINQV